jgi:hypothetical protein
LRTNLFASNFVNQIRAASGLHSPQNQGAVNSQLPTAQFLIPIFVVTVWAELMIVFQRIPLVLSRVNVREQLWPSQTRNACFVANPHSGVEALLSESLLRAAVSSKMKFAQIVSVATQDVNRIFQDRQNKRQPIGLKVKWVKSICTTF